MIQRHSFLFLSLFQPVNKGLQGLHKGLPVTFPTYISFINAEQNAKLRKKIA
jgi:hypothetical protein